MPIEYPALSLTIRELANGMWTVSSFFVFVISAAYLHREARTWGWKAIFHDRAMQFAAAWCLLIFGHCIRSAWSWGEFITIRVDAELFWLFALGEPFLWATFFVIVGKLLCIYTLSSPQRRWLYMAATLLMTIGVPIALYYLIDGGQEW